MTFSPILDKVQCVMEFKDILRESREKESLTKAELSRMVGISSPYLTRYEKGELKAPPLSKLKKIIKAINLHEKEVYKFTKAAFYSRLGEIGLDYLVEIKRLSGPKLDKPKKKSDPLGELSAFFDELPASKQAVFIDIMNCLMSAFDKLQN